jgi:Predicted transcriptional regulators
MKIVIMIKQFRKARGMTVRRLARLSGVSHVEILRIESGEVSPSLDTLLKLSIALRIDLKSTFVVMDE